MNRPAFFNRVRVSIFSGKLTQNQVDGLTAILDAWETTQLPDLRWLAYMLGTAKWETAGTMQAVEEYGRGKGKAYGKPDPVTGFIYYGRGLVQLTWAGNYQKMGSILAVDLYHKPDLALNLQVAIQIMFEGMTTGKSFAGDFTGKHLGNYFNKTTEDWVNARRIINGTDKAQTVASLAQKFYQALT